MQPCDPRLFAFVPLPRGLLLAVRLGYIWLKGLVSQIYLITTETFFERPLWPTDKIWAKRQEIQEITAMYNVSGGDVVAEDMDAAFVNDCHPETNTKRWKIVFAMIYIALRLALLGQGVPINNLNYRVGPVFTFLYSICIYIYMCFFPLSWLMLCIGITIISYI